MLLLNIDIEQRSDVMVEQRGVNLSSCVYITLQFPISTRFMFQLTW